MKSDDILDAKVGSSQVTAIYLGSDLIWPTAAYTYQITGAILHYSRGNRLDAGVVGSNYTGNYVWVTGTVIVSLNDTPIDILSDVLLTPTVGNTNDFVVLNGNYIYGYNLGTTETSRIKSTSVDVTYLSSPSFTVGSNVEQVINYDNVTWSSTIYEDSPVIAPDEVPNTRYVDLVISRYDSSNDPCPAYGDTTSMYYSGGHDMANYSTTHWEEWTTYTHTYTSGAVVVDEPEMTDEGTTPPVMVGNPWTVGDNISAPTLPSWTTYSGGLLRIDSEGTDEYINGRYADLTVTNGGASDTETVYQQYNVVEGYDNYILTVDIDVTGMIPYLGGLYHVDYVSTREPVWTSGSHSPAEACTATVSTSSNVIADEQSVSGSGYFGIEVLENTSHDLYKDVIVTLDNGVITESDTEQQDISPVIVTTTADVFPEVDTDGSVIVRLWITQGTFPANPVEIRGIVYHYILDGTQTEQTVSVSGARTITSDGGYDTLPRSIHWFSGTSGVHWISATEVTGIGLANTTFSHEQFDVR